ncbi:hypothetical protein ABPG72_014664 [Tetrahymena utriculariae]
MSKILKSLDLFSTPFLFNLQNNSQKRQTAIGGLVSVTVFSLSLVYFTYICYLYSNNKIDPTVNQSQKVISEDFFMTIQNNILAFQIYLPNGQTLEQYQNQKGITYIIPTVSYKYPDPNNNDLTKSTSINLIKCEDPDLDTFYCFDFTPLSNMKNQMDFGYDANFLGRYMFEFAIVICDASILDPSFGCASEIKILLMARFFDQQIEDKDSEQIKLFKELINETQKQLSITELQQELMQMKIIIRLILSKEQFAAIQLCGYFIKSEQQHLQNELKPSVNHKIEKNQEQQNNFHETKFLNKQTNLNQIRENKNINESYSIKSDLKYNKVENCNKFIQSIENILGQQEQKDSQDQKINNDDIAENSQLDDKSMQLKYENHLDAIQQVEKNEKYFEACIQKFLDQKLDKSELDKRILGCMIGFDLKEQG